MGFGIDCEVTREGEGKDKRERQRERERDSLQYFTVIFDLKVDVQLRSVQLSVTHNCRQSHQSHKQLLRKSSFIGYSHDAILQISCGNEATCSEDRPKMSGNIHSVMTMKTYSYRMIYGHSSNLVLLTVKAIMWNGFSSKPAAIVQPEVSAEDAAEYELEITDVLKRAEIRKDRRSCLVGIVVSDKNEKSVTIKVDREKYYPKYQVTLNRTKKFMAHDEDEVCEMGDLVRIVPCRPMSKMKRHTVLDVIRKADRLDIVLTKEDRLRDPNRFY